MEIVSKGLLFIEFFFSHWEIVKTFTGVHILSRNICFGDSNLQYMIHWFTGVCLVHGWVSCFQRLYIEGRNEFSPFCS